MRCWFMPPPLLRRARVQRFGSNVRTQALRKARLSLETDCSGIASSQ
jgi:hypothetical protein